MDITDKGFGRVIEGDGAPLSRLRASTDIAALVARHGVVVLRGFRDGVAQFEELTDSLGTVRPANIRPGTSRRFETGKGTQAVNAGNLAVPLHAESYFTPICPQILAFTCVEFTASGGETLFCDGIELFQRLPLESREALRAARIAWHHQCAVDILEAQIQQSVASFQRWCEGVENCHVTVDDTAGQIVIDYVAPAIRRTWWGGDEAFANNLIPIQQHGALATMSPGLDPAHVIAAERLAAQLTVAHRWQSQDIALLDNTRVMHGRSPWSGGVRHLRVRMMTVESAPC